MTAGDCSREKKRIHRYNRRQSVRKVLFLAAVLMAAAAFCCTAIRAFTTNLTDDEAYTYINYVRAYQPLNLSWLIHLYSTCKANNHWLNTFLNPSSERRIVCRVPCCCARRAETRADFFSVQRLSDLQLLFE